MDDVTRSALESIRLDWAVTPDDVWEPRASLHVPGLHEAALAEVLRAFDDARRSSGASPLGVAIRGPAGSGKTHLLGQLREQVQAAGGYFFLIKLLDGENFWRSILVALLEDLSRGSPTHRSQSVQLIDRLGRAADVADDDLAAVVGEAPLTRKALDAFVNAVYRRHPRHRRRSQHILRALVLTESDDFDQQDVGTALLLADVDDSGDFAAWGIQNARLGYQEIVENISRIIAMDDAAVVAVDQIDTLIATNHANDESDERAVNRVAHGLMTLRESMSRTISVVSCVSAAWDYLEAHTPQSVIDRYRIPARLQRPSSVDFTRALLAKRFAQFYTTADFVPPYPTWPVTEEALATSIDFTPRDVMRTVDRHVSSALRTGEFAELMRFEIALPDTAAPVRQSNWDPSQIDQLGRLDRRFAELVSAADPRDAFDHLLEDAVVPPLLADGLATWIDARISGGDMYQQDAKPGRNPALHARLRRTIDPLTDAEQSWAFRAIGASHFRAVQSRLDKAGIASGVDNSMRSLILLRRDPWPRGAKTVQMLRDLRDRGAALVMWTADDVKVLMALAAMRAERSEFLAEWILSRNPAQQVGFLAEITDAATQVIAQTPAVRPSAAVRSGGRSIANRLADAAMTGGLSESAAKHLFASGPGPISGSG
ncbi:ATP-binding protein [Gordonia sp. CPCC 205333]|uniref:ATP-binding protein n=1 Tax=Gordonia sp. CPCC 205333 TaxID=3140790 RepID=UPI003AF33929